MLLTACGNSATVQAKQTALTFWYTESGSQADIIQMMIKEFNDSHNTIHVTGKQVDLFSLHDTFIQAARIGQQAPDVLEMNALWTAEFASKQYLLQLDGKIDNPNDFASAPLAETRYNGHVYGAAQSFDFMMMYYNKDIFTRNYLDTPPATMKDLADVADTIHWGYYRTAGFGTPGTSDFVLPFIYAAGGKPLADDNHTITIDQSPAVDGLDTLLSLIRTGDTLPIDLTQSASDIYGQFKSGKVAIIFGSSRQYGDLRSGTAFAGDHSSDLGVAAIPAGEAGADSQRSPAHTMADAVYAASSHKNEAITFLNYLSATPQSVTLAIATNTIPARQSALQDARVHDNPYISPFIGLTKNTCALPATPSQADLFTAFDKDIQPALTGSASSQDVLTQVKTDWQGILK
jgi:ABC-type glycerol-3-phosphate transport system substrate-binding protein